MGTGGSDFHFKFSPRNRNKSLMVLGKVFLNQLASVSAIQVDIVFQHSRRWHLFDHKSLCISMLKDEGISVSMEVESVTKWF